MLEIDINSTHHIGVKLNLIKLLIIVYLGYQLHFLRWIDENVSGQVI